MAKEDYFNLLIAIICLIGIDILIVPNIIETGVLCENENCFWQNPILASINIVAMLAFFGIFIYEFMKEEKEETEHKERCPNALNGNQLN